MGTFAYIARDPAGQKVEGKVAAATAQAVLADLQSRKLAPVQVREVAEQPRAQRRMSPRKLATAYRQLADLLRAGVPLLRGLRLLGRSKSNPRLAKVMSRVGDAVADGSRLADAMAAHGEVFPDIQIAMVRAGERGGFLEPVLRRMGDFLEQQADLRDKVVGNLIYPATLLVFMAAVIVVALVGIVPKFRDFYSRITLPWATKALLAASDACTTYGLVLLIVAAVIGFALWRLSRASAVRMQLAIWQLKIPGVGNVVKNLAVGRFARILGTLLENGIPMLQAMQISRGAAGHILLAAAIDQAAEAVRSGEALATPLSECGLFSDDVIEMIRVGESANNLPQVLITVAETIEKRIDRMLTVLVRLMEPALLAVMGGAVFFIFVALIVPMMRMSSSFQH
jgi:general secretion pathway protein F/type IV pilus assembly protein PilC